MISPTLHSEEQVIHRKRNWIATVVTIGVLCLLSGFVWKILSYVKQIREGTLDVSSLNVRPTSFSSSVRLAAMPVADQPVNLVTSDDPSLGRADAPMTIVEFADFVCPYSKDASFTLRELSLQYPEKIHYIYRDFPITDLHPLAQKAAEAGECAAQQGRFWEYHDKLYQNQQDSSQERLYEFASELNLNTAQFRTCLDSGSKQDEVLQDYQDGLEAGVRGTPTFFINGTKIQGAIPKDVFEQLIASQP